MSVYWKVKFLRNIKNNLTVDLTLYLFQFLKCLIKAELGMVLDTKTVNYPGNYLYFTHFIREIDLHIHLNPVKADPGMGKTTFM